MRKAFPSLLALSPPLSLALLLVSLPLLLGACGGPPEAPPAAKRTFAFDSGGAHHIQGFGAWRVHITSDSMLVAKHQVRDDTRIFPAVPLPSEEAREFWALVDAAALPDVKITPRPGVPDESELTFGLSVEGGAPAEVTLWQNDLGEHPALLAIRDALRSLIETHLGEKPVF